MNNIDQKNSTIRGTRDPRNQNQNIDDKNALFNNQELDITNVKETDDSNQEIAERGFTVRNGYDPNKPNPDQDLITSDDLDDLDDDFHKDRDLEDDSDAIYEVELEDEDDDEELDANGNHLNEVNDEFDNPSDDFNETEEDLEDIDQDDEEEEEDYVEEDVQEEEDEVYPDNDPRKF